MTSIPLSSSAQAVLSEVLYQMCAGDSESYAASIAAAVLRAAADQTVPEEFTRRSPCWKGCIIGGAAERIRSELLAIANELNPL